MQSVSFQQKSPGVYVFARTHCCNVRSASGPDFWWGSWAWRRLHCILLNFFINNLDRLASPCKHWEIGLSSNFSLHYYAPNQYVNLSSPLALGEGCIRRNLYSECHLAVIFWEASWELELARRQETLELWLLSCVFVMYTPIMIQLAFLFKKQAAGSWGMFV